MPELPEVMTVVKHLKKHVENQVIEKVEIKVDKLIREISAREFIDKVQNQKIIEVNNRGKFIVFFLENNLVILSHLRLEGHYKIINNDQSWTKHDHLAFKFKNQQLVYTDSRQFGTFHLRSKDNWDQINPIKKLAPTPFEIDPFVLFSKLQTKRSPIKTTLLDQSILSGLGNIYVNEVLFRLKIDPRTSSKTLTLEKTKELLKVSQEILSKSIEHGGSTIKSFVSFNDSLGDFQNYLKVHGKKSQACPRCKKTIQKIFVGQRGTYFCPNCQV